MKNQVRICLIGVVSFAAGAFITSQSDTKQPVTADLAAAAARLIGLSFTPAERDSMLDNLSDQRRDYETIRAVSLPNEVAPALYFNPLPKNFTLPAGAGSFRASAVG